MSDLEKWIEAALTVADTTSMKDAEIIPTWPSDVAGFYPTLTIGALREWQVSQAKQNPDYRTVANRAIGDIARVTELLGVPEEEAGRPIVELVQEFLEAREHEGVKAVAYACHACGDRTMPPAPFSMSVKCQCGHTTAATIAANLARDAHPPQSQGVPDGWNITTEENVVRGCSPYGNFYASDGMSELGDLFSALCRDLLSTPAAPQADEWVKCADRLPEKGVVVLVVVDYAHHAIKPSTLTAHWTGSTFKIGPNSVNFNCDAPVVTHWMPLPLPPEQEGE